VSGEDVDTGFRLIRKSFADEIATQVKFMSFFTGLTKNSLSLWKALCLLRFQSYPRIYETPALIPLSYAPHCLRSIEIHIFCSPPPDPARQTCAFHGAFIDGR